MTLPTTVILSEVKRSGTKSKVIPLSRGNVAKRQKGCRPATGPNVRQKRLAMRKASPNVRQKRLCIAEGDPSTILLRKIASGTAQDDSVRQRHL